MSILFSTRLEEVPMVAAVRQAIESKSVHQTTTPPHTQDIKANLFRMRFLCSRHGHHCSRANLSRNIEGKNQKWTTKPRCRLPRCSGGRTQLYLILPTPNFTSTMATSSSVHQRTRDTPKVRPAHMDLDLLRALTNP